MVITRLRRLVNAVALALIGVIGWDAWRERARRTETAGGARSGGAGADRSATASSNAAEQATADTAPFPVQTEPAIESTPASDDAIADREGVVLPSPLA